MIHIDSLMMEFQKLQNRIIIPFYIFEGTLENGQMFDSSRAQGRQPLEFQLGKGKVIKG